MTFEDVLNDIQKLIGFELNSINGSSNIIVQDVDHDNQRITVFSIPKSKNTSRSFSELNKIWTELSKHAAIHVDSVLLGSGSSRNQPETILANLPYVQWMKYKNKKHLTLNANDLHNLGELKRVDPIKAEDIKKRIKKEESALLGSEPSQIIVVSGDVASHAKSLEAISGVSYTPIERGVYEYIMPNCKTLLVSKDTINGHLKEGTYLLLDGQPANLSGMKVSIGSKTYLAHDDNGLQMLFPL